MLPSCVADIVFDYALQLKVSAINHEIKRRFAIFKSVVMPYLTERWQEWVDMESPRALFYAHVYGPEGGYELMQYSRRWWVQEYWLDQLKKNGVLATLVV